MSSPRVIAVTGATGFTGPFVVQKLREGYPASELRCLVREHSPAGRIDRWRPSLVVGDLRSGESLNRLLEGADTLVNVSSLGFEWTDTLMGALGRSRVNRGVFVSTTAILTSLPVRSKPIRQRAEQAVQQLDLAWTIIRPTMIYGTPEDRNIARLVRFVQRSPVVPLVAGGARQQPVHVEDVASAVVAATHAPAAVRRIYNIAGRDPMTLRRLVEDVVAAIGCRRLIVTVPSALVMAAVRAYGAMSSRPRLSVEQVLRLQEHKDFSYADAARDFGFAPRSFREGVREEVRQIAAVSASR